MSLRDEIATALYVHFDDSRNVDAAADKVLALLRSRRNSLLIEDRDAFIEDMTDVLEAWTPPPERVRDHSRQLACRLLRVRNDPA